MISPDTGAELPTLGGRGRGRSQEQEQAEDASDPDVL